MSINKNTTNSIQKEASTYTVLLSKEHIEQIVLSLALICRASERSIVELLKTVFDYEVSLGKVHNILAEAIEVAGDLNDHEVLSNIKEGAHDEIFQGNKPVLVGIDQRTSYCYLLQLEPHRNGATWWYYLSLLKDKGLIPNYIVADGGKGLRSGQSEAWPEIPCHADVFHALHDVGKLLTFLENRALKALREIETLEKKVQQNQLKNLTDRVILKKLKKTRHEFEQTVKVLEAIETFFQWLREDILAFVGPSFEERKALFEWMLEELEKLESIIFGTHIKKVRISLSNQHSELILFTEKIGQQLEVLASELKVDPLQVRRAYEVLKLSPESLSRVHEENKLCSQFGNLYYLVNQSIKSIISGIFRASSCIENLNSRLRNYFFLRKSFKQGSLDLLRFFFNHKRFTRSYHPGRVEKSPAELLYKRTLPHWLEMLGYTLFKRAAA